MWGTFIALLLSAGVVQAEVTDKAATGFTSVHQLTINATPTEVYAALTERISHWWTPHIRTRAPQPTSAWMPAPVAASVSNCQAGVPWSTCEWCSRTRAGCCV